MLNILRCSCLFLFIWLFGVSAQAAGVEVAVGDNLREALDRYAQAGLNVVSTTRVLPTRLQVTQIPDRQDALAEQVRWLLLPHGLDIVLVDPANAYVTTLQEPELVIAATREVDDKVAQIVEEMVVTSHYQVRRNANTLTPLDHEDLLTMPSLGRDTLRGLEMLPGVASGGISARHRFRGGDLNETLYRFDGIELLEPFHLPNEQALFSAINLNIVDAADVYIAGFPVSMGARMSGVVDLQPTEPVLPFAGGIDVNMITTSLDARGLQGNWSWLGSARRSVLHHTLGLFETDYGKPRFHDEFLRLVHDNGQRAFVGGLLRSQDRIDVLDDDEQGRSRSQYQAGWLRMEANHGDDLSSNWQISAITIENQRVGAVNEPSFSVGSLSETRDFETLEIANDWVWRAQPNTDLELGWSIARQDGKFRAQTDVTYGILAQPIQMVPSEQRETLIDRSGESLVAYAAVRRRFTDKLTLETGLRYDGQDIDPVHVNEISGRLSLDYTISSTLALSLDLGRYTQQQHLYEIQIDDGKAELDPPQHSDQINLTTLWQAGDATRLRMDVYFRDVDNPWSHFTNLYNRWVLLPELQGDRYELLPSEARAKGVELSVNQNINSQLSWHASYAYAIAREYYSGGYQYKPWQQTHSVKAGLRYSAPRWRFGLNAVYRSGWPTTPFIADSAQLATDVFDDRLPKYFSLDLHLSRMVALPRGNLEFYLDVMNLTNHKNVGGYDYFADERDSQELLPITPTLGMMWRWGGE